MTITDAGPEPATPQPDGPADARRLLRRREDRKIAGVCAALGTYTDIDPVIFRVVLGVLALFGGAGLALYALGWLLIPEAETGQSPMDALLRRPARWSDRRRHIAVAVAVVLAILIIAPLNHFGSWAGLGLAALAVIGFLWLREHRPGAAGPTSQPAGGSYPLPDPASPGTVPLPARAPRPRSPLGWVTLCAALMAVGVGLLLDAAGLLDASLQGLLATALVVLSIGLLAGAWIGRARWLVLPALAVAGALAGASVISGVPVQGGTGHRLWVPAAAAELPAAYRLGAGDATLDLTGIDPTGLGARGDSRPLRASVGVGGLDVRLPAAVPVTVHAHAGGGRVEVLGLVSDGLGVDRDVVSSGARAAGERATLDLDLRVGIGAVSVTRVTP